MSSGIYKIHFGGDKLYVGSAVNLIRRKNNHLSALRRGVSNCPKLQRAFNKYGEALFIFEVLEYCVTEGIKECEAKWIKQLDSYNNGYNSTESTHVPMLGRTHSKLTKLKMGDAAAGNKANTGKVFTVEHRLNMSIAGTGRANTWTKGGEEATQARLTQVDVDTIRYFKGVISQARLGKLFGVCQAQIWRIHTGKRWK